MLENYRFKYQSRNKFIYVPNDNCERRAVHLIRFLNRNVEFPDYFYHYRPGGHVAALHDHLSNELFFKIDIQNFFYSIARNRVSRVLVAHGLAGAPAYAKWSCVRNPYGEGPRYVIPIGFRQSPLLATMVLMHSPVAAAIERAKAKGAKVSVYLDDFIGSHMDQTVLREAYEDIRHSCAEANLIPNPRKLVEPSRAIEAFNCDLRMGATNVTAARIAEFYESERSELSMQSFDAYLARVAAANR